MSKKTNTLWFILGATVFNILVTIVSFVVLFILFARFLAPALPETAVSWSFPIIFIGSIALSFVIYRIVLKRLLKKINVEKHFDPIFGARKPPVRRD
jgi:membrane protein implicated in regulation of membrane protease activity